MVYLFLDEKLKLVMTQLRQVLKVEQLIWLMVMVERLPNFHNVILMFCRDKVGHGLGYAGCCQELLCLAGKCLILEYILKINRGIHLIKKLSLVRYSDHITKLCAA
jgi:hypothetical protein